MRTLKELLDDYCSENSKLAKAFQNVLQSTEALAPLMDEIANNLPLYYEEKQKILEAVDLKDRFRELSQILANETNIMRIKRDIQSQGQGEGRQEPAGIPAEGAVKVHPGGAGRGQYVL